VSADRPVSRWLAAVVMAAAFLLAAAAPAVASPVGTAASPGQRIAASLRTSPLYVDPSLASAFPPSVRTSLIAAIRKAPVPVFVIVVPMINGGGWSTGSQLATIVHNALGTPGVYLTPDAEFGGDIDAFTWPSDPSGTDAPPYHAADAAQAVNLAPDAQDTTLAGKFSQCIALISDGRAVSADNAATRALDAPRPAQATSGSGGSGGSPIALIVIVAVALLGGGTAGLLLVRRRRRGGRGPSPFVSPHAVFSAARSATEAGLRTLAQQQVIALGELVERPSAGVLPDAVQEQVARALDAYEAAGKVLDAATGVPDLAGTLVLTHLGRDAMAAADALRSSPGAPPPAASPLCFFNPLHGVADRAIRWRPLGERQALTVRACAECAASAENHRLPDVLTDLVDGREVPYYEVAPERSVWAATGYGQLATDLVQRILTGGGHPAR